MCRIDIISNPDVWYKCNPAKYKCCDSEDIRMSEDLYLVTPTTLYRQSSYHTMVGGCVDI